MDLHEGDHLDSLVDLERHRIADPGKQLAALLALQRADAPLVVAAPGSGCQFTAGLWAVDGLNDGLALRSAIDSDIRPIVQDAGRLGPPRPFAGPEPTVTFSPCPPQLVATRYVRDISRGRPSFLLSPADPPMQLGQVVVAAEIELDEAEFFFVDFEVRNVVPHPDGGAGAGALRVGCSWTRISPQALALIAQWLGPASRRKEHL